MSRTSEQSLTAPISAAEVSDLLAARILISGTRLSDLAFLQTMLSLSGFTNISTANGPEKLMQMLRQAISGDLCDIDLIILDCRLGECNARELRLKLDQFDEWRLIPVIALTEKSQWNHNQLLTDLGHGVTSLLYRPLTAESLPPAVMTTLAAKRERDHYHLRQQQIEDENAQLRVMEARLQFSVNHDDLTGLANRRRLEQALDITLTQVRNFHTSSALFYIDLDSFKVLNDAEGHEAGDTLLVQVANSLRSFFKVRDTLVRIGSDEFAVLVDTIEPDTAIARAEGLREMFDGYSFTFHDHEYHLSASIGVKCITEAAISTVGEILSHANQACYTAKKRGRNRVHVYSPADREMYALRHSVEWAPRIRAALKQENFILEFQPIYSLKEKKINHYECLIRMRGQGDKLYYPHDFIPVAEAMGLIHQIDLWVVNHAFELLRNVPGDTALAVNLSGNIFLDKNLYPLVERKLLETGADPSRLVFEITETSAISNFEQTKQMVDRLRNLGCRFALDDFGAGFNSYSYLKHFPVDILKIDGGFITNLHNDPVDQLLVKSMIDISHSLGKKTVAEFVEDRETLKMLEEFGVDFVQGYLIGKPQRVMPTKP
ncbi:MULTISPECIES: EAL domain-containing protein [unclassified Methylophaga]|jgi:diguanylate cyclase (GGDEF)-like protein|uniref:putative bifunctional diguanylate cyclase/phosphodiesterase n=2 Tax=Methylophaga TaxID=40222 RepID=UPI000C8A2A52|nr:MULTISPECIES: EAL domain-containing protein [unclassified Methylophaga]MAK66515.1 GGDEF-domain containing protein [Methylophaga sp.]MAY17208.1 GGDEF-domain containing protein [Methylophaga sp.]HCD05535.1 GGDEF-domain containing protein [Methylophaga sp.]|tara:strand:- start:6863 stop:8674 length:1812 start_codon:yes stop_codon:yes gene_type:complete